MKKYDNSKISRHILVVIMLLFALYLTITRPILIIPSPPTWVKPSLLVFYSVLLFYFVIRTIRLLRAKPSLDVQPYLDPASAATSAEQAMILVRKHYPSEFARVIKKNDISALDNFIKSRLKEISENSTVGEDQSLAIKLLPSHSE